MNMSGFDEKQTAIRDKISSELNTLPPIFSEYISYLKDAQKTLTTMLSYLSTLTACLRTIRQDYYISNNEFYKEISATDIEYYFAAKGDLGTKALQSHWSVLNSFFKFLVEKGYLTTNPMGNIRRPIDSNQKRKLNNLTKDEYDRLLLTVKQNPTKFTAFRDEVIIKLAVSTGLEASELVNLNYDNIDFANGTIRSTTKSGERIIPVGSAILSLLNRWIQFRESYFKGSDTPALFVSTLKHRLSVDAAGGMLQKYCEQAHVPKISFKDLKATMVYLLARENVSMDAIMQFLNISDYMVVVQAYDAAMKEKEVDILSTINELIDAPIISKQASDNTEQQHKFSVQVIPPKYSTYQRGEQGFTVYVNMSNLTDEPLKIRLKSCSVYTNGMLRTSDYTYSGYQFDEDFILPKSVRTFGKIWITDSLYRKQLLSGEYLLICLVESETNTEHHIKFVLNGSGEDSYWVQDSWYSVDK